LHLQGISGTKYALDHYSSEGSGVKSLGGVVRSPLPQVTDAIKKMIDEDLKEAVDYENSL
jgi:F420-0:gamma-glutamyl ligase-like protein